MVWSLQSTEEFTESQFVQWSKLVEERTGIQLSVQKKALLQSQVSIRMREVGCTDYNQYFQRVTSGLAGLMEWSILVDRLTVKETSFFRHRPSVEYVRRTLQNRINNRQLDNSFDIWSVGCASGEEPYSLAMVVNDCFELAKLEPYYGITATDISSSALSKAREGYYPARRLSPLQPDEVQRYMIPDESGQYRVADKLRERVCFSQGNITQIRAMPVIKMDVIFCQNLLVYFRRWLRRDILNAFAERLKPGGVLMIGLGEAVDWEHPGLRRVVGDQVQAYVRDERQKQ
ncbi:CheR family methyltransferase [Marinimicrobium sp. ARAG 43.8]|uniref:CheR family methyltransferase n=1 Tax=Marinimicrobium sp. ARAG 43.8 TaxID=3418719 RepID=UPI003CED6FD7